MPGKKNGTMHLGWGTGGKRCTVTLAGDGFPFLRLIFFFFWWSRVYVPWA